MMKTLLFTLNFIVSTIAFQQGIQVKHQFHSPSSSCCRHEVVSSKVSSTKFILKMSDNESVDEKLAKKIVGRKKRVVVGYKITSISYLLLGLVIIGKSRVPYYGMGPILVSGLGHILSDAALNNRLASDTYKRLNLSLIGGTLFSCTGNFLMQGFPLERFLAFVTIVNSIKGYGYGLKGWELNNACAKEDLLKGTKQSIQIISKTSNFTSAAYLAMTLTVGALIVSKFKELIFLLVGNKNAFVIGTRMYRFSKLLLIGAISFTLKDAADRDRLQGTTFINLNYLNSLSFATMTCKSP